MTLVNEEIADIIESRTQAISVAAVDHCWQVSPGLQERFGDLGRQKCVDDVSYHLMYLSNAIAVSCPALFTAYLAWSKDLSEGLGIATEDIVNSLVAASNALERELTPAMYSIAKPYMEQGIQQLLQERRDAPSFLADDLPLLELTKTYMGLLLKGNRHAASGLILDSIEAGTDLRDIYMNVFQQAQYETGRLWQTGQITVAQEHLFSASTQMIMSQLYPRVFTPKKNGRTLVAACIGGDLHEIGCRMVADFFEMDGWDTYFFGANTPTKSIVDAAISYQAEVLAISATMTFHVRSVARLVAAIREANPSLKTKVLVGGYPFKIAPNLWRQIGADGSADDATGAVVIAEGWFS